MMFFSDKLSQMSIMGHTTYGDVSGVVTRHPLASETPPSSLTSDSKCSAVKSSHRERERHFHLKAGRKIQYVICGVYAK